MACERRAVSPKKKQQILSLPLKLKQNKIKSIRQINFCALFNFSALGASCAHFLNMKRENLGILLKNIFKVDVNFSVHYQMKFDVFSRIFCGSTNIADEILVCLVSLHVVSVLAFDIEDYVAFVAV